MQDVVVAFLKFLALTISGISGMVALFYETHDKRTKRLTKGGTITLCLILGSLVTSLVLQACESYRELQASKSEATKAREAAERTEAILSSLQRSSERTEIVLANVQRTAERLDNFSVTCAFEVSLNGPQYEEYKKKLLQEAESFADASAEGAKAAGATEDELKDYRKRGRFVEGDAGPEETPEDIRRVSIYCWFSKHATDVSERFAFRDGNLRFKLPRWRSPIADDLVQHFAGLLQGDKTAIYQMSFRPRTNTLGLILREANEFSKFRNDGEFIGLSDLVGSQFCLVLTSGNMEPASTSGFGAIENNQHYKLKYIAFRIARGKTLYLTPHPIELPNNGSIYEYRFPDTLDGVNALCVDPLTIDIEER
jgi:hypothetical protein